MKASCKMVYKLSLNIKTELRQGPWLDSKGPSDLLIFIMGLFNFLPFGLNVNHPLSDC